MMAASEEVHFEIYVRARAKAGWRLSEVVAKREEAIAAATALVTTTAGARVVKQVYDPKTCDFLSIVIFEVGEAPFALDPKAEDLPNSRVCRTPRDFYSRDARLVIARLLGDYLGRQRLTPTELLHRADALKIFETTTGVFQHAVQRVAIVRSASSDASVQRIIKDINALVISALRAVYSDAAKGVFPTVTAGGFAALSEQLAGQDDALYRFNGALAAYIKPAATWDGKLARLIGILDEVPEDSLAAEAVDTVIEEVINSSAAIYDLVGGRESLNLTLTFLLDIFFSTAKLNPDTQIGLAGLMQRFSQGRLKRARQAIIRRVIAELKSSKRLSPACTADEVKALMRIAARLAQVPVEFLDPEDLIGMLTVRSRFLVTPSSLNDLIARTMTPEEKLQRLLDLQPNVLGAQSKRQLAAFIYPLISSGSFESHFVASRPTPSAVLNRLADYQSRILASGFAPQTRGDMACIIDRIAIQVEQRNNLIKTIESRCNDRVDKALALFSLCESGVPQGRIMTKVHRALQSHLQSPGFTAAFAAKLARTPGGAGKDAASELQVLMEKAGMDPSLQAA